MFKIEKIANNLYALVDTALSLVIDTGSERSMKLLAQNISTKKYETSCEVDEAFDELQY